MLLLESLICMTRSYKLYRRRYARFHGISKNGLGTISTLWEGDRRRRLMLRLGRDSEPTIQNATAAILSLWTFRGRGHIHLKVIMRQQFACIVPYGCGVLAQIA